MASKMAIAGVLAFLHELYPSREIGTATAEAWSMTFAEWDDATLESCARSAALTPGRSFFPTPGEIAAFRVAEPVDAGALLREISALGQYNPHSGWLYPRIDAVRERLGDAIASAYAAAGAERCFADDDSTTQSIARRAFGVELAAAQKLHPNRPLLCAPTTPPLLAAGAV